jgi:hypothetical protein
MNNEAMVTPMLSYARNDVATAKKHLWWGWRLLLIVATSLAKLARLMVIGMGYVLLAAGVAFGWSLQRLGRLVIHIMNLPWPRRRVLIPPRPVAPA